MSRMVIHDHHHGWGDQPGKRPGKWPRSSIKGSFQVHPGLNSTAPAEAFGNYAPMPPSCPQGTARSLRLLILHPKYSASAALFSKMPCVVVRIDSSSLTLLSTWIVGRHECRDRAIQHAPIPGGPFCANEDGSQAYNGHSFTAQWAG